MANPGGVGTKFASLNLNKSYGQPSHHNHSSGSYGQAAAIRGRSFSGGGGLVVLSRARTSQKAGPKLSVPPPLNLPSLRKEHERFDLPGSAGGPASSGSGPRPNSAGMGWTKPAAFSFQEKSANNDVVGRSGGVTTVEICMDQSVLAVDGVSKDNGGCVPSSAQLGGVGATVSASARSYTQPAEKATVLRGEDFPSLRAALPTTSAPLLKQKDGFHQKEKQGAVDESFNDHSDRYHSSKMVYMRPQEQSSSQWAAGGGSADNGNVANESGSRGVEKTLKQEEYFPGPLPLVRFSPRSDWADDERDTSHGFAFHGRDQGLTKNEYYWDADLEMPRSSVLPHRPSNHQFSRRDQRDNESMRNFSGEASKLNPSRRDTTPSKEGLEGNAWSVSSQKDGFRAQETASDKINAVGRPLGVTRDIGKENNYITTRPVNDGARDSNATKNRDFSFGRRDIGHISQGRQQWNNTAESFSGRGTERNSVHRCEQSNLYGFDAFKSGIVSKSPSVGRDLSRNDSGPVFGREKRAFSKSERSYGDNRFAKDYGSGDFDENDPFPGVFGIIKRKKEVKKVTDFHDPVRESFEAELERVQKIQEIERQRIIEEQERALDQARREEEERQRLIREEEERLRRQEEEAQEAAWRAEQERLEAIRRAEEQKLAREEEKKKAMLEEERRKQAAKQKLLELEARIAKRQAEAGKVDVSAAVTADDKTLGMMKESEVCRKVNLNNWDDNERMVEKVATSTSDDSSILDRPLEMGSWAVSSSREGSSGIFDRGKPTKSWRKDVFDDGTGSSFLLQGQENMQYIPRRDAAVNGRSFPRKDFYGGTSVSRNYFRGEMQESYNDEFNHLKEQGWNFSGVGDQDHLAEKYGDIGWGQGPSNGISRSPWPDQLYSNSEADELYSYGRSRYAVRQPRVLPPPSVVSINRAYRDEIGRPGPSAFPDNDIHFNHGTRSEPSLQMGYCTVHEERHESSNLVNACQGKTNSEVQKVEKTATLRCDSQSSLSMSSPPNSPPHLSHDELDVSGESLAVEGKDFPLSVRESVILLEKSGQETGMVVASSSVSICEDDEWTLDNNGDLQEQEVYDEDEDGYQEEDEAHEGDDEELDLTQEFEHMHVQDGDSSGMMDNLVLCFNEGVEVGIPSDEFERNSRNDDSIYGIPNLSDGQEEQAGEIQAEVQVMKSMDCHSQMSGESSFMRIQGTERAGQDSVIQLVNAPNSSMASNALDFVDVAGNDNVAVTDIVESLGDVVVSASCQTVNPTSSAFSNQADLPVKVHFGLFSGPSLIPSPVPAIQIGSIQMPLHLHPPVGPSLTHIRPSQQPLFQFGQLRYTSPISQGILPMASQSMSYVQPNMHDHYNLNHNSGGSLPITRENYFQIVNDGGPSISVKNQIGCVPRRQDLVHEIISGVRVSVTQSENAEKNLPVHADRIVNSQVTDNMPMQKSNFQAEDRRHSDTIVNDNLLSSKEIGLGGQLQAAQESPETIPYVKGHRRTRVQGSASGGKGKRFAYAIRNSSTRSFDASQFDSSVFQRRPRHPMQRTEFRVRANGHGRHPSALVYSNNSVSDGKLCLNGKDVTIFSRSGSHKGAMTCKQPTGIVDKEVSGSVSVSLEEIGSGGGTLKEAAKGTITKNSDVLLIGEGNLKRNISEEDVDAPLQSGIVRVFKQPGIEAPSDEDDFIEVRSKRQMLNDRREQREKEIKAKSRFSKGQRKALATSQNTMVLAPSNKAPATLNGDVSKNVPSEAVSEVQGGVKKDSFIGLTSKISQHLAPIGTPVMNIESHTDMGSHMIMSHSSSSGSVPPSGGADDLSSSLMFETKDKVMALTQTQLDDAMKPVGYDAHVSSVGGRTNVVNESMLPSSSILTKGKPLSSGASPISSLLAGEKIQFGALTSPTILHAGSHLVLHGIGPPGPVLSDIQISHKPSTAESDCSLFFEKDKEHSQSCVNLEDCEAEAEAAASAVAVAAISSDEMVDHGLGPISVADSSSFGGAGIDRLTEGASGDQRSGSQSKAEDSLIVSLPADLSVETPPISLWPTFSSPQNSSSQALSHIGGGPLSHFPFYEMTPMLGGPIFAFGPQEESASSQSQPQKSTTLGTGPLGTWQQCHSTVDSFYGSPAGFTGPFISPAAGMSGVQVPQHMLVYNHFAPVGQYGQVGLSFMGTTYIPSGKQPDWKHSPTTSAMGIGEIEMNHLKHASGQCNPSNIPSPIQHITPGSALLPMAPPLAMFDVSPFQSASDISSQVRWSHLPVTPLPSVPMSLPLQQSAEGLHPPQFNQMHSVDQPINVDRFPVSENPSPENLHNFPVVTDAMVTQIPDGLGLIDSSTAIASGVSAQKPVVQGPENARSGTDSSDVMQISSCDVGKCQNTNGFKAPSSQQKKLSSQQSSHSTGYSYQRSGIPHKSSAGSDWSQRRIGFNGRNQSLGAEKGFPPAKVKQIYVAKQNTGASKTG